MQIINNIIDRFQNRYGQPVGQLYKKKKSLQIDYLSIIRIQCAPERS